MTAIDVLARSLYETVVRSDGNWDALPAAAREAWTDQALVVAERMTEAEPAPSAPTSREGLQGAVEAVRDAAGALNTAALGQIDATDWQDAIRYLLALRDATDHIGVVAASLTKHTYLVADHGDQDVEGVGRVKIIRARDRKQWEPREAVFAYLDARMMALEGEVPDPTVVADWVMDVLPATASTSCKVSGLKAVGLDPKAFCEDTPGPIRVELPPRT